MSEVSLIPLAIVGDEWTVPDETLLHIASLMRSEGTFERVFYDGVLRSPEDFVEYMHRPSNLPVFFFRGYDPLGFAWLNGIRGGTAFAHFCGLKSARGYTREAGALGLRYWLSAFDFLSVFLGVIAGNNQPAVRYVERIGFKVLGEIPNLVFDAYAGGRVPGVLTYYAR